MTAYRMLISKNSKWSMEPDFFLFKSLKNSNFNTSKKIQNNI
jgi:hypothetical protein